MSVTEAAFVMSSYTIVKELCLQMGFVPQGNEPHWTEVGNMPALIIWLCIVFGIILELMFIACIGHFMWHYTVMLACFTKWTASWIWDRRNATVPSTVPESKFEGSTYFTSSWPKCMMAVHRVNPDFAISQAIGCALRMGSYLIAPAHVVELCSKGIKFVNHRGAEFEFAAKEIVWKSLEGDVAYVKIPDSITGVSKATVKPINKKTWIRVVAAMTSNNASVGAGWLEKDWAPGTVVVEASTRPGFSGAAYIDGDTVVGMHLGGGKQNTGVSMAYLQAILANPESDPALLNALKTARKTDFSWERRGLDDVLVRIGGTYFDTDMDFFGQLMDDEQWEHLFYEEPSRPRRRNEVEPEAAFDAAIDKELDFLEMRQRLRELKECPNILDSPPSVKANPITLLEPSTKETQPMLTPQEVIAGYLEAEEQCSSLSESMPESAKALEESLQEKRLSDLDSKVACVTDSMKRIDARLESLPELIRQILESGLTTVCATSTQKPQLVLEQSREPPLERHWDGMDSHIQAYQQWKNSVDIRRPDFAVLRSRYLSSLGLTEWQEQALMRTLRNRKNADMKKRQRLRPAQMTSRSSSKMNPTRMQKSVRGGIV